MLTRDLAVVHYDWQTGGVRPDRLTRRRHEQYVQLAHRMLEIYRHGRGTTRKVLHRQVGKLFDDQADCPMRRPDAFCKLLDEKAIYANRPSKAAPALRRRVFQLAAKFHPIVTIPDQLFGSNQQTVRREIAEALEIDWTHIETDLFADVIEFHRLESFPGYDSPELLLARYNVAQCQAVLYDATQMTIWSSSDFKKLMRGAKLARLMHRVNRLPDGRYRIVVDGPASVLRRTQRYGAAMARFLPTLISCSDWKMHAKLKLRQHSRIFYFQLTSRDGYRSSVDASDEFDSNVEQKFAEKWGDQPRDGWTLRREDEILFQGQKVFIPDFTFEHADGRRAMAEVIGFWTPEYLSHKAQVLKTFDDYRIVLIVAHSVADSIPRECRGPIVTYKTAIKVNEVLRILGS